MGSAKRVVEIKDTATTSLEGIHVTNDLKLTWEEIEEAKNRVFLNVPKVPEPEEMEYSQFCLREKYAPAIMAKYLAAYFFPLRYTARSFWRRVDHL